VHADASRKEQQRHDHRNVLRKLGETVRSCRRARGLTQEDLARSLGMSTAYISLIERGRRNPPYTRLVEIARVLAVRVRDLVVEE
jgi:transcriptional regulator with XRE-family HTH domain